MNPFFKKITDKKHRWAVILGAILFWGFILRFWNLGGQSLWIDESYSTIAAKAIAESGKPILQSGVEYWRGWPHTYLVGLLYALFGKSEWVLRFPALVFGMAWIWLVFFTGDRLFKNRVAGLIGAAFAAIGTYSVAWSRQIRMYSMHQFFFLLTLVLFYLFFETKGKRRWWMLGGSLLSAILTIKLHDVGLLIVPSLALIWLFYFPGMKHKLKLLISSPFVLVFAVGAFHFLVRPIPVVIEQFKTLFWWNTDYIQVYLMAFWKFYAAISVGSVIGLIYGLINKDKRVVSLALVAIGTLIGVSINRNISIRYILFLIPMFCALAGYGVYYLARVTPLIYLKIIPLLFLTGLIFMPDNQVFLPRTDYFLEYAPEYKGRILEYSPQPDFKKGYELIRERMKPDDIFIVAHTAIHDYYMPDSEFYWIEFPFKKIVGSGFYVIEKDGEAVERYTGKPIARTPRDLAELMASHHGYVLLDHFALAGHVSKEQKEIISQFSKKELMREQAHPDRNWTTLQVMEF